MAQPFPSVLGGRYSGLEGGYQGNGWNGLALPSPTAYGNLAAWYDIGDVSTLTLDGSNRCSLIADKSGNSAVNCLLLPGVSGNYASAPDSAALDITGDIDLRALVALDDWTPSSEAALVAKWSGSQLSYALTISTSGNPVFGWTEDGTTIRFLTCPNPTGLTDFSRKWVRVAFDVDNGASGRTATFYLSDDGSTWSVLGAATSATATSIFSGSAGISIGARGSSGADNRALGRIYRAQIRNGIDGTIVFDADFSTATKLATGFTESSSNAATVTINQTSIALPARIHGERDRYQGLTANQPVYDAATRTLTYDGSNDYTKTAPFALSQPETVYFVGKQVSWTSGARILDGATDSTARITQVTASPQINFNAGLSLSNISTFAVGTTAVVGAVANGAASSLSVNRTTATTGNAGTLAMNGLTVGAAGGLGNYSNITESAVLVYSAAHDQATQDRVIAYLSAKWGIQL